MAESDQDGDTYAATILSLRLMWAITIIMVIFVVLRLVVRVFVVRRIGPEDYSFAVAGALGVASSILFQLGCDWGFYSPRWSYKIPLFSQIMIAVVSAQNIVLVALGLAKMSIGLFLLNLVVERWHRMLLWGCMAFLTAVTVASVFVTWFECTPVQALWDVRYLRTRKCFDIFPVGVLHTVTSLLFDFIFAIMPWFLIWPHTKISRKDKLQSCICLSFGFLYEKTLSYLVWPIAELTVTIICVATPAAVRPLYLELSKYKRNQSQSQKSLEAPGTEWISLDDQIEHPPLRLLSLNFPEEDLERDYGTLSRQEGVNT